MFNFLNPSNIFIDIVGKCFFSTPDLNNVHTVVVPGEEGLPPAWMRACKVQQTWTVIHSSRLRCNTVEPFHAVVRPWSGWSDLSGAGRTWKQAHWKLITQDLMALLTLLFLSKWWKICTSLIPTYVPKMKILPQLFFCADKSIMSPILRVVITVWK